MNEQDFEKNIQEDTPSKGRRSALKTMLTLPVVGVLGYGVFKKVSRELSLKNKRNLFSFENKPKLPENVVGKQIQTYIMGDELKPYIEKIEIHTDETKLFDIASSSIMFDCLELW